MKKIVCLIIAVIIGIGVGSSNIYATGLLGRAQKNRQQRIQNRHQVQQQRQLNKQLNQNHHHDNQQQVVVERVIVEKQRVQKVVEVPNVKVKEQVVVTKDQYGNVLNVQKQKNVQKVKKQKVQKVVVEQYIRGY